MVLVHSAAAAVLWFARARGRCQRGINGNRRKRLRTVRNEVFAIAVAARVSWERVRTAGSGRKGRIQLGKLMLYQLSYVRVRFTIAESSRRTAPTATARRDREDRPGTESRNPRRRSARASDGGSAP